VCPCAVAPGAAELLQETRQRQDLRLHLFVENIELWLKLITDRNDPTHFGTMSYTSYDVNAISCLIHFPSRAELVQIQC